jgi:hypothetical protein
MIWDVKLYLAKIKDGKGKDLNFLNKKSLPTITRPKIPLSGYFSGRSDTIICQKSSDEMERICDRLSHIYPS